MAKLILSLDGMVLREYPLTKERTTIGRKPHNDIVIDNLAVSGEHAMIMTILNDSFLEDLGSTNGTLVNGQPIKKHFLQNNDVVELGKYKLKYVAEAAAAAAAAPDFEKTMVLRAPAGGAPAAPKPEPAPVAAKTLEAEVSQPIPKNFGDTVVNPEMMQSQGLGGSLRDAARQATATTGAGPAPAAAAAAPAPAQASKPLAAGAPAGLGVPPAPMPPVPGPVAAAAAAASASQPVAPGAAAGQSQGTIQILSGPSAGKELPLSKPLTTLGKPGVQVAVIAKRPQGYFITHVEGPTYPVVNGKHLDAQAHALGDHDVIELAGVKMEFFLKPA
jgi:predicted component of type VI protein secretion system